MEQINEDKDRILYKVILIGDSFVGKTSLIIRFCNDTFESSGIATVGIDTKTKFIKRKDKKIELQIWDTAGQERFRALSKNCTNQMDGIILVYDMNNKASFKSIKMWYNNLKETVDFKKVAIILVGNKCDIENPQVDHKSAQEFCFQHGLSLLESSAKNNINVSEIFSSIIDIMLKLNDKTNLKRINSKLERISHAEEEQLKKKKKKNCC